MTLALTPRETEILKRWLVAGNLKAVATALNRSDKTIAAQKGSAMRKLQVENDVQLVKRCIQLGLTSAETL
jgi:two-component system capsular synthesis response regulator RcsB